MDRGLKEIPVHSLWTFFYLLITSLRSLYNLRSRSLISSYFHVVSILLKESVFSRTSSLSLNVHNTYLSWKSYSLWVIQFYLLFITILSKILLKIYHSVLLTDFSHLVKLFNTMYGYNSSIFLQIFIKIIIPFCYSCMLLGFYIFKSFHMIFDKSEWDTPKHPLHTCTYI